jgi:hypothetical protein
MKIYELFAQHIEPGAGQGPTSPTTSSANTATGGAQMGQQPQNMSNIKNNLNNLKGLMGAAGASGNIDTSKIASALGDPKQATNPNVMQALKGMLPGLADALQNNQAAGQIKAGIKTGVEAQQQLRKAQQDAELKAQQNNLK